MACNRYRDLLSRYVDNEVTPRQRRDLLAHVERCHECAAYLARLRQADVLLKGVPDTGPSDRVKQVVLESARRPGSPVRARNHASPLRPAHAGWGERPGDTDKDKGIAKFKAGFGGDPWRVHAIRKP